jgi:hypothetical protein
MKALTLYQPWASLVALGHKTVETRKWATTYRGPLAIHAGISPRGFNLLPGDCEGTEEGGWRYGYIGDFQAAYCHRSSDEGQRGDAYLHDLRPEGPPEPEPIPLGVVVAVADLVDCAPILNRGEARPDGCRDHVRDYPQEGDLPHQQGGLWLSGPDVGTPTRIEQERQFGDFTPGRFAWVLENVQRLVEPVEARGWQGLWEWEAPGVTFATVPAR